MITRRLVAGPSRTFFYRRHLAAPALAPSTTGHVEDDFAPSVPAPPSTYHGRVPPPAPRLTISPEVIQHLLDAASQSPPTPASRQSTWTIFRSLSPTQRVGLPSSYLRTVLAAIVPKYDEAWQMVQDADNRSRQAANRKLGYQWERRLKSVMSELVLRKDAQLADWLTVMRSFMRVGYISACESVVNELPPQYRQHVTIQETRLGTIVRWLRNLEATNRTPRLSDVEIAHAAFWEVFRDIQDNQLEVTAFALRLLLQASCELSNMIVELRQEESVARFDEVLRYVFLNGYGMDLDNLPTSVEERALDTSRSFPLLSAKAMNATLSQLRRRGTDAWQLLTVFDLLTARAKVASNVGSAKAFEDEEDEDFVPTLSSQTAAEESGQERRNWMGLRVNQAAEFFESSSHPTDSSTPSTPSPGPGDTPSPDPRMLQRIRRVRDYLPDPPAPGAVIPATDFVPPAKQSWDADTVLILLQAAAQGAARRPDAENSDLHLMLAILELGVHDVLTSNAAWLSAYLACPVESRNRLRRPQRISPEWFRYVLARQSHTYGRSAARTKALLKDVLHRNQQMIDAIEAHESRLAGGAPSATEGSAAIARPSYLGSPQRARKWRNADIFNVSEEIDALHQDLDKFRSHLQRAEEMRLTRKARARSRLAHESPAEGRPSPGKTKHIDT